MNMKLIEDYIKNAKSSRIARYNEDVKARSKDIFQISEFEGKLWFTYDNNLICPCEMMKKDALEALVEIRSYYIVSNMISENK